MWYQATRSGAAATAFIMLLFCAAVFALIGAQQTASRLTWSLARDRAIIGSKWLSEMHPKLEVPVWSLMFNFMIMFIIGCIYLGSSSAFNAFIGSGLVLQHISYAFPAALIMYRKRSELWLPRDRSFRMPAVVGWTANSVTIGFAILVLIFYDFPSVMPVTGSNMSEFFIEPPFLCPDTKLTIASDYTSAVLGVMAIFAGINWVIYARKKYDGPRLRSSSEGGT